MFSLTGKSVHNKSFFLENSSLKKKALFFCYESAESKESIILVHFYI